MMVFISDISTLRTFDPERGMELFHDSASSDGRQGLRVTTPRGEFRFDAHLSFRDATPQERQAQPDISRTAVYRLSNIRRLPGLSGRETCEIAREALLAQRLSHRDGEVNWEVVCPATFPDELQP